LYYEIPVMMYEVCVVDTLLYTNLGNSLKIIDISDPSNPVEVSSLFIDILIIDLTVSGDYAYIADWGAAYVVDISNPFEPEITDSYDVPHQLGSPSGIDINDNTVCYSDDTWGMRVIDVSDPYDIQEIGFVEPQGSVRRVDVCGDYVYCADVLTGLRIIDASDPENPVETAFYESPTGIAYDVKVQENIVYLADSSGVVILDCSDPTSPEVLSYTLAGYMAYRLQVRDQVVFLGDFYGNIIILDANNPMEPELVSIFTLGGNIIDLEIKENFAYIAKASAGLDIVDISDIYNPFETGWFNQQYDATSVGVVGDYAYLADDTVAVHIIDVSDPYDPELCGSFDIEHNVQDFFTKDTLLFFAQEKWAWNHHNDPIDDFVVMNVADPENPVQVGNYNSRAIGFGIAVQENRIFLADTFHMRIFEFEYLEDSVERDYNSKVPSEWVLETIYPNPFNPSFEVVVVLPVQAYLQLNLYNINGQEIVKIYEGFSDSGRSHYYFDGSDLPSGVYFVQAIVPGKMNQLQKVMLVK